MENTIIIGSGDHGEDPFKDSYVRVAALNSNVLHTASYIYYPQHLMPNPSMAERLRKNTQKMTHILDMYPTIQGIINGGNYDVLQHTPDGCITGVDLTSVDIPEDRVTISINLASSNSVENSRNSVPWQARLWALSTTDSKGRELTLYHRRHKFKHPNLKQGTDNFYILEFGECTRNISNSNLCMQDINEEYKEIFRRAIQWLKHTPFYHDGVKNSELVEHFGKNTIYNELDRDEVGGRNGSVTPARKYDSQKNLQLVLKTLMGWAIFGCIVLRKIRSYLTGLDKKAGSARPCRSTVSHDSISHAW